MRWVPLIFVFIIIILLVISSRFVPIKITEDGSAIIDKSPVNNAVKTIIPKNE